MNSYSVICVEQGVDAVVESADSPVVAVFGLVEVAEDQALLPCEEMEATISVVDGDLCEYYYRLAPRTEAAGVMAAARHRASRAADRIAGINQAVCAARKPLTGEHEGDLRDAVDDLRHAYYALAVLESKHHGLPRMVLRARRGAALVGQGATPMPRRPGGPRGFRGTGHPHSAGAKNPAEGWGG